MIIFVVITFLLVIYAYSDLLKSFAIFLCIRLFLNLYINFINIPGLPILQVDLVLCIFYSYMFVKRLNNRFDFFIYKRSIIFLIISLLLSTFFSQVGFYSTITRAIAIIFQEILFIYIVWLYVQSANYYHLRFFSQFFVITTVLVILYSIYSKLTNSNPLMSYESSLSGVDFSDSGYNKEELFGGENRLSSIFIHPIGAGANMVYMLALILVIFKYKYVNLILPIKIVFILGMFVAIFTTGSRTPLVGIILVFIFAYINTKRGVFTLLIVAVLSINFLPENYLLLFKSIFLPNDTTLRSGMSGSTLDMRLIQLETAWQVGKQHFLFGLGLKGFSTIKDLNLLDKLMGIESIWFKLLIERGIVGVFAYIVFYFEILKSGLKKSIKFNVLGIGFAYIVMNTISSLPGEQSYLVFLAIFMILKTENKINEIKLTVK
jgi:hypothetical protein